MEVRAFGLTHVGRQRQHNEDTFLVDEKLGLALVARPRGARDD